MTCMLIYNATISRCPKSNMGHACLWMIMLDPSFKESTRERHVCCYCICVLHTKLHKPNLAPIIYIIPFVLDMWDFTL